MKKQKIFFVFVLFFLSSGCMPGGYYFSTPHRELRGNPYYSYPPGEPRGQRRRSPIAGPRPSGLGLVPSRSGLGLKPPERPRPGSVPNRPRPNISVSEKRFFSREIDYIFRDATRTLGSETRREIRRGIRDIFR